MLNKVKVFVVFKVLIVIATANDEFTLQNYFEDHFYIDDRESIGRNALKYPEYKWPNGVVPYAFDEEYIERDKSAVLSAMEIFRKETCIKFVLKRSNHTQYVKFKKSKQGCGSLVGYNAKRNESVILLTEQCLKLRGAIQHEILHALGLLHEQSRPDRDDYVDIYWDNIEERNNFYKFYFLFTFS